MNSSSASWRALLILGMFSMRLWTVSTLSMKVLVGGSAVVANLTFANLVATVAALGILLLFWRANKARKATISRAHCIGVRWSEVPVCWARWRRVTLCRKESSGSHITGTPWGLRASNYATP